LRFKFQTGTGPEYIFDLFKGARFERTLFAFLLLTHFEENFIFVTGQAGPYNHAFIQATLLLDRSQS